jgi:MFS family permease
MDNPHKDKPSIPPSIWALGFSTFLINLSSAIIFGLSAVYMKTILGVSSGWIGFLEGAVEGCAYLTKLLSGVFSDYLQRRKKIMVVGFALAVIARPLLALFSSFGAVFTARLLDRLGNGIQSTPRDALVGDLSPPSIKGKCYGLRQSLATAGSFFAGIVGTAAMVITGSNYQQVFWIATIPAVLALVILVTFVKEPKKHTADGKIKREKIRFADIPKLGRPYWLLMIVATIFMCARVGEAMLILHAHQNFGLSQEYVQVILMLYNGTNSLVSFPVGYLSDKISRYYLLMLGFLFLIAADAMLAFASNLTMMLIGVGLWGVQIGITQSMFMALIADKVPARLRGTGFGFFYLISALALIVSGTIGGTIAQNYGEANTFLYSGIVGTLAALLLLLFIRFMGNKSINKISSSGHPKTEEE